MEFLDSILSAFGGPNLIVVALVSVLGKIWVDGRINYESNERSKELEAHKAGLAEQTRLKVDQLKNELEIQKNTIFANRERKVLIYDKVIDLLADLLPRMDRNAAEGADFSRDDIQKFHVAKMKIDSTLMLYSPEAVVSEGSQLIEYLSGVVKGDELFDSSIFNARFEELIKEMRKDVIA
ncbi:MAG: hypothetical protein Tsb002_27740 [Wenzhouxiangellaceae bacterium]